MAFVDIILKKNLTDFYDLSFVGGDLEKTEGFASAVNISIFCEKRASASEVAIPEKRRGWWGNAFLGYTDFEYGSKLWLLLQARASQKTLNNSITYSENALQWFIEDNYLDKVVVSSEYDDNMAMLLNVQLIRSQDIVFSNGYRLWENTITELTS